MTDEGGRHRLQVLSSQEEFGSVVRCPRGCIHICVGNTSLRLSTKQYWELVDLLAESTKKIASLATSEHDTREIIH